ncbi:MAG TPA: hypothetical protein VK590_05925, partial [Saprospiraceae bacterium]|nr:hypothetical protein [Saprospiraceae bacterium]
MEWRDLKMGLLSIKTAIVGTVVTATVAGGLVFGGGGTIDSAKAQLNVLKDKIVSYETSEGSLLEKISLVKNNANTEIGKANT